MYENGVVVLDLADIASDCLNDSDDAPARSRCEVFLLILPASKYETSAVDLHAVIQAIVCICALDPGYWELS